MRGACFTDGLQRGVPAGVDRVVRLFDPGVPPVDSRTGGVIGLLDGRVRCGLLRRRRFLGRAGLNDSSDERQTSRNERTTERHKLFLFEKRQHGHIDCDSGAQRVLAQPPFFHRAQSGQKPVHLMGVTEERGRDLLHSGREQLFENG